MARFFHIFHLVLKMDGCDGVAFPVGKEAIVIICTYCLLWDGYLRFLVHTYNYYITKLNIFIIIIS